MKRVFYILLTLVAAVSSFYLIGLGYYNIFVLDDLGFIPTIRDVGVLDFITDKYFTWQGRFSAFFINGMIYSVFQNSSNLIMLTIVHLIFGYLSIYLVLKWLFPSVSKLYLVLMSIVFVNLSIKGIIEFSTFYWACATAYIGIVFITIYLMCFVFNSELHSILSYVFIILFSLLISGFAETYTPLVIMIFGIVWLKMLFLNYNKGLIKNKVFIRLSISLVILCIGFIIMLIAPGNKIRMLHDSTHHPFGLELILKTFRAMIQLFFYVFPKLIYSLLLFPLYLYLGTLLPKGYKFFSNKDIISISFFIKSVLILFLFLYIALAPGVFAVNGIAPSRSLSFVSFVINGFLGYWGIALGFKLSKTKHLFYKLGFISNILIILIFTFFIANDFPHAKKYKNDINTLHSNLIKLNESGYKGVYEIKPISTPKQTSSYGWFWNAVMEKYKPSKKLNDYYFPYMVYSVSTDPDEWRNRAVAVYLGLNYKVIGWDEPEVSKSEKTKEE